nr:ribosomal L7Ae/L30e/S12e/Gadd45 family protein [Anaerosporobacter sp.]
MEQINTEVQYDPNTKNKILSYIGIATKAGKVASGEFSSEKAVKEHKAELVIVASDASDNTKKMFTNMCTYYKVPIYFFGEKSELGHAMGKEMRASLAMLDKGLADATQKQLKNVVE